MGRSGVRGFLIRNQHFASGVLILHKNFDIRQHFAKYIAIFREMIYTDFAKESGVRYMNELTIQEAAAKWSLSARRIQQLCKEGKITGARKSGRTWLVPAQSALRIRPKLSEQPRILPLPVGISGYIEAVTKYYYVDKTLLIRDFIDALPKVSLFTRPRRFGKTLNMDMLRVFFERSETDTSVYFRDKAIWACGEYYRSFQGKYPVIYLSFKDVKYASWENALKDIAENIRSEYARHDELAGSAACNTVEKQLYRQIIRGQADEVTLSRSLALLSAMLCRHYGRETVIIIDEYDTPIQQGYVSGYYDQVIAFIRNLFSGAFKDNPNLAYGFLTGILRVAKESIFSGMNNLKVNTVLDDRYSEYFGFSRQEVSELLAYYGREDKTAEVCSWYNGYQFGKSEIFNPWSVINYVDDGCFPKAFWQFTGSNEIIGSIIASATPEITANLRLLIQGESILTRIDTGVIYPEVQSNPSSIYSFLLVAGYLRCTEINPQNDGNFMCRVSVPNTEISCVYAREIIAKLSPERGESTAAAVQQAIFVQDTDALEKSIGDYLRQTISVYDTGSEAFYQGLMIGLCAILNNRYNVRSNRESGLGRFDIQLYPVSKDLPGFIFELKASKKSGESLERIASDALRQIAEKEYESEMRAAGVQNIVSIGMAFRGKETAVKTAARTEAQQRISQA